MVSRCPPGNGLRQVHPVQRPRPRDPGCSAVAGEQRGVGDGGVRGGVAAGGEHHPSAGSTSELPPSSTTRRLPPGPAGVDHAGHAVGEARAGRRRRPPVVQHRSSIAVQLRGTKVAAGHRGSRSRKAQKVLLVVVKALIGRRARSALGGAAGAVAHAAASGPERFTSTTCSLPHIVAQQCTAVSVPETRRRRSRGVGHRRVLTWKGVPSHRRAGGVGAARRHRLEGCLAEPPRCVGQ
jgi:hypothetical protein